MTNMSRGSGGASIGPGPERQRTKGMTEEFSAGGVIAVLASWQLYAAAAAGITATWMLQNAYHAGRLAAAQPGITLADPAVSTAWGILVFQEQVSSGYVLVLTVVPLAVLAGSVFMLSRSPVLQAAAGAGEAAGKAQEDTGSTRGVKDEASRKLGPSPPAVPDIWPDAGQLTREWVLPI